MTQEQPENGNNSISVIDLDQFNITKKKILLSERVYAILRLQHHNNSLFVGVHSFKITAAHCFNPATGAVTSQLPLMPVPIPDKWEGLHQEKGHLV